MRFLLLLLALTFMPVAAHAGPPKGTTTNQSSDDLLSTVFTAVEAAIISDYYGVKLDDDYYDREGYHHGKKGHGKNKGKGHGKGLPPGLAKKDSLPPGLAKQLEERGTLPPGLAKRDLPRDLLARLPHRKGTKRIIVDNDMVLIEESTNIVLDVLADVIKNSK